ncbi:O antigen biosynthesis protein [Legionella nautarum]|uniref:O antigen biosynthesis protein n=1 Tax=Legionella nautarum TaxID=45070 RepID=A0A0W0WVS8_9GAMM|nr:GtrA family protein [Legionella nautarum]KTD36424.1 O antigen biosynthesis protein [Legionella nautarum]
MSSKEELIRYILVGILNTLFSYLWYAFFITIGLRYPVALLFSTVLGVLFNFKTFGKLVFKNSNNQLIFKFIGVYTFLYFFNITLIGFLKQISTDLYLTGFISIIFSAGLGFILNKHLVFKTSY